ncbi:MAG: hypothetical protein FJ098_10620, partial [Deltaproteobacteria bacterium]|nr:hypothetical protein [Deltaproteobacteria bacterium]
MARLFVLGWMVLLASGSPARAGGGSCPYDTGSGPLVWQDREPGIRYATFAHPGKGTELPKVFAHLLSVSLDAGLQPIAMRPLGGGLRLEQMVKVLTGGRGLDIRAGLNGDYFSFGDRVKDPLGLFITRGQLLRFPSGTSSLLYDAEGRMHMGIFSVEQEVRWDGGAITVDAANDVDAARRDAAVLFSGVYSDEVKGLKGCWVVQGRAGALEPMINRTLSYDVMDSGYRSGVK